MILSRIRSFPADDSFAGPLISGSFPLIRKKIPTRIKMDGNEYSHEIVPPPVKRKYIQIMEQERNSDNNEKNTENSCRGRFRRRFLQLVVPLQAV